MVRRIWVDGREVGTYISQTVGMVIFRYDNGQDGMLPKTEAELTVGDVEEAVYGHCWLCNKWRRWLPAYEICNQCKRATDDPEIENVF